MSLPLVVHGENACWRLKTLQIAIVERKSRSLCCHMNENIVPGFIANSGIVMPSHTISVRSRKSARLRKLGKSACAK